MSLVASAARAGRLAFAPLLLCLACSPVPSSPSAPPSEVGVVATARQAVGEEVAGFPNDQERMLLVLTNQARHDPRMPDSSCGQHDAEFEEEGLPKPPFAYDFAANRAARGSSQLMQGLGCFQHDTCCVLGAVSGGVGCVGQASCSGDACSNKQCTGGTPAQDRYALLGYAHFTAQNISRADSAMDVWCNWMDSRGSRRLIYGDSTQLGVGAFQSAEGCGGTYWTQAFGSGPVGQLPRIPAASAMHPVGTPSNATGLYFAANYYDETGRSPGFSTVVVDGVCQPLEQKWGVEGNGTFEARFNTADALTDGCHSYYFVFYDADGKRHTYPSEGSLRVAVGNGQSCPEAYVPEQQPSDCEQDVLECTAGETRSCYTGGEGTEGVGECRGGTQRCEGGFWSICDGQVRPGAEVCNGLDDDCNGEVDDGNPGGGLSCTVTGERGVCAAGQRACIAGALLCVSSSTPSEEVCDGVDNDCDGTVDDGLTETLLTCGKGLCFNRVAACSKGEVQTCVPGTPGTEVANWQDDDCDGVVDNGVRACTPGQKTGCRTQPSTFPDGTKLTTGGNSTCRDGTMTCQEDGTWGACEGEILPAEEVCDGKDNDCDGLADEAQDLGAQRCGEGACLRFSTTCSADGSSTCTPGTGSTELCNGKDDSCNGTIDEGCFCQEGAQLDCWTGLTSRRNVGVCKDGKRTCRSGAMSVCEGEVQPSEEVCGNGLDDDCDGELDECPQTPDAGGGVILDPDEGGADAGTPDAGVGPAPEEEKGGCAQVPGLFLPALALTTLLLRRRR